MGMVSIDTTKSHGKQSIKRDQYDDISEWDLIKYKDKLTYSQNASKEIFIVAKAKGVSEDDIWKMGQLDYYMMLNVLEMYNNDLKNNNETTN